MVRVHRHGAHAWVSVSHSVVFQTPHYLKMYPHPPTHSDLNPDVPLQLTAAAALANLSGDRCGLEAMVADQELLLPPLWALARGLVVPGGATGSGGGEWLISRRVNSRMRLFVCVLLANAMGHPVLAKASAVLGGRWEGT